MQRVIDQLFLNDLTDKISGAYWRDIPPLEMTGYFDLTTTYNLDTLYIYNHLPIRFKKIHENGMVSYFIIMPVVVDSPFTSSPPIEYWLRIHKVMNIVPATAWSWNLLDFSEGQKNYENFETAYELNYS